MRIVLIVVPLVLLAVFAMMNWPAFIAPVALVLGWWRFEAPLGLLMLLVLAAVTLFFLVYMGIWQARILAETRQHARELAAQRALADQAEASRFTELRATLGAEVARLEERIAACEGAVRAEIEQGTNSLAAMLGEIDDRQRRGGPPVA
jgi:uncharacterized integral membrane protein